jgi:hypothetical protein
MAVLLTAEMGDLLMETAALASQNLRKVTVPGGGKKVCGGESGLSS